MSFFRHFRLRPPTYTNTGSVARDHLASERTFLAWIRTGLGFVALGIAVERFSQLDLEALIDHLLPDHAKSSGQSREDAKRETADRQNHEQMLVGALLGTGGGSIVYGATRYFGTMRMLEKGLFRPSYFGAGVLSTVVSAMAGGAYWGTLRRETKRREAEREAEDAMSGKRLKKARKTD
ncbi:hypothetical protein H2198_001656 [Neophaeococcomyces mojaviensis]|uniref:Uncharacterized protein n=1 Tax=Neophaeococcomyces mojaviensis TaxID=3383035 RepID=A0ACC3AGC5_9EURO|nr:hypothetical protein H2198_001656 [Knufia sp. JES_112]